MLDVMADHGHKPWTNEKIITLLKQDAKRRGRPPTLTEWRKKAKGRGRARFGQPVPERTEYVPSAFIIIKRFGTWNEALEAASLPTRPRHSSRRDPKKCARGLHPWTKKNIYVFRGKKACRACQMDYQRRYRARKKKERR